MFAMNVSAGQQGMPLAASLSASSLFMQSACMIQSMPASMQSTTDWPLRAWAVTRRPRRWASSTITRNSSARNDGTDAILPPAGVRMGFSPLAATLMKSTPFLTCSRTPLTISSRVRAMTPTPESGAPIHDGK
ncbi:hypothetical protein G6F22_016790 [Rhizopus arrhizus]|nr:hypothetical protein G6F22_016790 [Rhizopus arrhizus]